MSLSAYVGVWAAARAKFVSAIAVYGLVSFVLAGAVVALLPEQATAVFVGWLLAAVIVGQLLRRRFIA